MNTEPKPKRQWRHTKVGMEAMLAAQRDVIESLQRKERDSSWRLELALRMIEARKRREGYLGFASTLIGFALGMWLL